jgi:hypothetical protein
VEAHEKWYQNLQRLRREQRQELDEWKRQRKLQEEEERKSASSEFRQQQESDAWVAQWRRQRETVRKNLDRWKVYVPQPARLMERLTTYNPSLINLMDVSS